MDNVDPSKKIFLIFGFLMTLVILNLIALDVWLFSAAKNNFLGMEKIKVLIADSKSAATPKTCPQSCLTQIKEATASLALATPTAIIKKGQTSSKQTESAVKEFFIPLGSGSTSADDWADVPGAQAVVDAANYNKIKKATFEVSMRVPTGNQYAYVRLYNATDGRPVWFSEFYYPGGSEQRYFVSDPINLESSPKLYKIQMKTQLKYPAILDQARLHIITY